MESIGFFRRFHATAPPGSAPNTPHTVTPSDRVTALFLEHIPPVARMDTLSRLKRRAIDALNHAIDRKLLELLLSQTDWSNWSRKYPEKTLAECFLQIRLLSNPEEIEALKQELIFTLQKHNAVYRIINALEPFYTVYNSLRNWSFDCPEKTFDECIDYLYTLTTPEALASLENRMLSRIALIHSLHTLLNEINQIGSQRGIDDLCSIYRETVGWSDTDPNMTFEQKVYHILLNVSPEAFEAFKSDVMRRLRQCDTEHSILSTLGNRYTFYKDTAEWSSTNKHKTLKECLRMVRSTTSQEELKTLRTDIIRTFAYQEVLQFLGVSHFALLEICPFNEAPTLSFQHCLFNIAIGTPEKALFLKAKITSIHPSLLSDLYKRKVREFLYPNTDFLATAVRVQWSTTYPEKSLPECLALLEQQTELSDIALLANDILTTYTSLINSEQTPLLMGFGPSYPFFKSTTGWIPTHPEATLESCLTEYYTTKNLPKILYLRKIILRELKNHLLPDFHTPILQLLGPYYEELANTTGWSTANPEKTLAACLTLTPPFPPAKELAQLKEDILLTYYQMQTLRASIKERFGAHFEPYKLKTNWLKEQPTLNLLQCMAFIASKKDPSLIRQLLSELDDSFRKKSIADNLS